MTRYIDHVRDIPREPLRRDVKMPNTRPIKSFEAVEMGVAEFENTLAKYHRAGGTRVSDQEMKDNLLQILPAELREALVWNSRDSGPFNVFRDMVTIQAAKVLMNRHKLPIHHVAGDAPEENEGGSATTSEFLAAVRNASSEGDVLAAFQRFRGKGGGKGGGRGRDAESGAPRSRSTEPGIARPRKCPN